MNHRLPTFAFPAEAGPHLPTSEGWKAELALRRQSAQDRYMTETSRSDLTGQLETQQQAGTSIRPAVFASLPA